MSLGAHQTIFSLSEVSETENKNGYANGCYCNINDNYYYSITYGHYPDEHPIVD